MAIIVLKAWYLESALSAAQVQHKQPDLRLSRTNLLKTGMRADLLDDLDKVMASRWYERYQEGELVEFYIEGSGAYSISNLDLISREMYFNKRNTLSFIEPVLFFCGQGQYPASSQSIRTTLAKIVDSINRSRQPIAPLVFEQNLSAEDEVTQIDAGLLRKLKTAVMVVADVTPVALVTDPVTQLIPSPQVCVEVGYALQVRKPEEIVLVQVMREEITGRFPFEVDESSYLLVKDGKDLQTQLSTQVSRQLQRAKLIEG